MKAGLVYHHAEPVYVMLTLWLPDYPPALPSAAALHQIGTGALVKNDKREVNCAGELLMIYRPRTSASQNINRAMDSPLARRC